METDSASARQANVARIKKRSMKLNSTSMLGCCLANLSASSEDAQRSESGLAWVVLTEGTGDAHSGEDGPPLGIVVYDAELLSFRKAPPRLTSPAPAPSE